MNEHIQQKQTKRSPGRLQGANTSDRKEADPRILKGVLLRMNNGTSFVTGSA